MSATGKYRVIAATTLEARRQHRIFIEEDLKKTNLTPDMRLQLEWELKQAIVKEGEALRAFTDETEEEEKKKKGESGDGSQTGKTGGSASGGGDSSGAMRGDDGFADPDSGDLEMFELLFVLSSMDDTPQQNAEIATYTVASEEPVAAATLLYNRRDRIAHIHHPYVPDQADASVAASEYVPALEQHAARMGAEALHLLVHADAVKMFQNELGYKPIGKVAQRSGVSMQGMRKMLTRSAIMKNNVF